MTNKEYTEDRIQQDCVEWFHNTYPELRGLLCHNKNNSVDKMQGHKDKQKGTVKGRADLVFYYRYDAVLHIEMKTPSGTQSPEQMEHQRLIESRGFRYVILRSLGEFQNFMIWYMNDVNKRVGGEK